MGERQSTLENMVSASSQALASDLDLVLNHTIDLLDELRGQRIFITGGTGFFGCWLLETFLWANDRLDLGAQALVLTRSPEAFGRKAPHLASHPSIEFHIGDVRSFSFPGGEFSHIIHAATAASADLNARDPLLMLDTIVEGTRRTLDFAVHCGARRLLFTSSGAVYGRQPPDLTHIPEDYPGAPDTADPASAYAQGKRLAEHLCALYARKYGLEAKIARGFAFVGPYLPLHIHLAIGNFIRDGMRGGPILVKGDGRPYRSYLYAADLAIWLWTILIRGQTGRPYNVGSEHALSIEQTARTVAGCFTTNTGVRILGEPVPGQPAERYVPSTRRAREELRLEEVIGIEEALRRTISWHQAWSAFSEEDYIPL